MLSRALIIKSASVPLIEKTVRTAKLFRPVVHRFIAGDSLEESLAPTHSLLKRGLLVTLDHLGENTASRTEALAARQTYEEMIGRISGLPEMQEWSGALPDPINISIKLTQCGLDQGEEFAEENLRHVLESALPSGCFVRVDMEGSAYTERTMKMMSRVLPDFANTGTVLQSYLYRTDEDVEKVIEWQARVRLVKGAYLEPASVAYSEKQKVDEAYLRQSKRLLDAGRYPAFATHDASLIEAIRTYAAEKSIDKSTYEFQMLYGIRRDLQESLVAEGHNVRVYIPFGDAWYPYFTRRLAERPANALFILKSLFKG